MSCGVGCRHGSDPALLWLWCRPAATAPIRRLTWEPPYAVGALKRQKDKKEREKERRQEGKKEEDQDHILRKYPVSSFPERKIEGKKREREKYF